MLRRSRFKGVLLAALGALAALSCVARPYPGSELIGTFDFTAFVTPPSGAPLPPEVCDFSEMPTQDFTFNGTFSRNTDGTTFFTLGDTDRPATFDGQYISSLQSAARRFDECGCPDGTHVDETLTVALLSRSQVDQLPDSNACPPNPLDGGIPAVGAGVTGPGSAGPGTSFDALLACGELADVVVPSDACTCSECRVTYPVQGIRK